MGEPETTSVRERLVTRLRAEGALPFAVVMEEALYGEGGYYRRQALPIGPAGDFVTGSAVSPLFGRATARLLGRLDAALGQPADYVEVGYGTADHLRAVMATAPGARRWLAWDRVARQLPAGVEVPVALGPGLAVRGLVFSYELFDALPVHRLIARPDGDLGELWVDLGPGGELGFVAGPLSRPELADLLREARLAPGQVADLAPGWVPLYRDLARSLERGLLVTCDYGFERPQLLDLRVRRHGTLACYRRHRVHRDPFAALGEQDLTAHVDWTALREAGEAAGLTTVTLTRQAPWLAACGLFDDLAAADLATRVAAMALLDGEGMGEVIRVLVQARGLDAAALFDLPSGPRGGIFEPR